MTDPSNIAATYAERVRRELRHLPVETVADLTDGLESDIASSLADGAALPSADEYAADLLRGAGMEPPEAPGSGVAVRITRVAVRVVGSARRLAPCGETGNHRVCGSGSTWSCRPVRAEQHA